MDKEELNRLRRKTESKFASEYVSMATIPGLKRVYVDGYVDGFKSYEQEAVDALEEWHEEEYKVGDHVLVAADVTGTGECITGVVDEVEKVLGQTLVSVMFDHLSAIGRRGAYISNLGLIRKI